MIYFRPLVKDDKTFLWKILYYALFVPYGQQPYPANVVHKPKISRYVQGWGKPHDSGFVALDGNKPVGASWLRLLVGEHKGYGYIDEDTPELSIAVLPKYRGQGLGTELLTRLINMAQDKYQAVCLSVSLDNLAKKLYDRLGFGVVGRNDSSLTMRLCWRMNA